MLGKNVNRDRRLDAFLRSTVIALVNLLLLGTTTARADSILLSSLLEPRLAGTIGFSGAVIEAVSFDTSTLGAILIRTSASRRLATISATAG